MEDTYLLLTFLSFYFTSRRIRGFLSMATTILIDLLALIFTLTQNQPKLIQQRSEMNCMTAFGESHTCSTSDLVMF